RMNFSQKKELDPGTRSKVYNRWKVEHVRHNTLKQGYLRSGDLARLAGVSTDTLRHYERKGLLARPRRSANGYREYPASALDRVRLVRHALGIGCTLSDFGGMLD